MSQTLNVQGCGNVDHISLCGVLQQKLGEKGIRTLVVTESVKILKNISTSSNSHILPAEMYYSRKEEPGEITSVNPLAVLCPLRSYRDYDLILEAAEGDTDIGTIFFSEGQRTRDEFTFTFTAGSGVGKLLLTVIDWLDRKIRKTPVWGCVLIGGMSSRMGRPKHLIEDNTGKTWLESTVNVLQGCTDQVVIAGKGDLPQSCSNYIRLPDIEGARGPLAGILSAMRWHPDVSWIAAACDMPKIRIEAMEWLLSNRKAGVWGAVPYNSTTGRYEPLLAYYSFQSISLFEKLHRSGERRITKICDGEKIVFPEIPATLSSSWRNCNTPGDIADDSETD